MSGTVKDIETMLGPLSEMLGLSQTTETLLVGLNSLPEIVLQKVRVLEKNVATLDETLWAARAT